MGVDHEIDIRRAPGGYYVVKYDGVFIGNCDSITDALATIREYKEELACRSA